MPLTVRMMNLQKIHGFQHVCSWDTTKSKHDPTTTTWICPWMSMEILPGTPGMAFEKHRILKWMANACHTHHQFLQVLVRLCQSLVYSSTATVALIISLPTARQIEIQEANHSKTTFISRDLKVVYGSSLISSVTVSLSHPTHRDAYISCRVPSNSFATSTLRCCPGNWRFCESQQGKNPFPTRASSYLYSMYCQFGDMFPIPPFALGTYFFGLREA